MNTDDTQPTNPILEQSSAVPAHMDTNLLNPEVAQDESIISGTDSRHAPEGGECVADPLCEEKPTDEGEPIAPLPPEESPDTLGAAADQSLVLEKLEVLDQRLDEFMRAHSALSREAFSSIKTEMEGYKDDFVFMRERSILNDFITLFDSTRMILSFYQARSNSDDAEALRERVISHMDGISTQIEAVLLRNGIERQGNDDHFDILRHRAIESRFTAERGEDRKVIEVRKPGFSRDGKVFRKADVVISRYQEPSSLEAVTTTPTSKPV